MKALFVRTVILSGLLLSMWLTGRAQDVRYNFLPGTDFGRFKSYSWTEVPNAKYPSQMVDAQIKMSIDNHLSAKGLRKVTEGIPDLYIAYQIALDKQTQWYSYGGVGWWWGLGTTMSSQTIQVGTLILDMYDVFRKKQVWMGTATKQLDPSKDPKKNQKKLDKAMAKLLKNYPPSDD